jgi:CRP-like cAMP-binding protein
MRIQQPMQQQQGKIEPRTRNSPSGWRPLICSQRFDAVRVDYCPDTLRFVPASPGVRISPQSPRASGALRGGYLVGKNVTLTQESLSEMIGVRRTSVSAAAGSLQDGGLIRHRRGHIRIIDIKD